MYCRWKSKYQKWRVSINLTGFTLPHAYPATCLPCHMLTLPHAYPATCLPCHMLTLPHVYPATCLCLSESRTWFPTSYVVVFFLYQRVDVRIFCWPPLFKLSSHRLAILVITTWVTFPERLNMVWQLLGCHCAFCQESKHILMQVFSTTIFIYKYELKCLGFNLLPTLIRTLYLIWYTTEAKNGKKEKMMCS